MFVEQRSASSKMLRMEPEAPGQHPCPSGGGMLPVGPDCAHVSTSMAIIAAAERARSANRIVGVQ